MYLTVMYNVRGQRVKGKKNGSIVLVLKPAWRVLFTLDISTF